MVVPKYHRGREGVVIMQIADIGNSSGMVYHYTTLEAAVGIIKKEGIVFRAGRYDAMNDPEDSVIAARSIEKSFGHEVAYAIADPYTYNISPYLVSFCKENDLPLMWRLYNAKVTLHIDSDEVRKYCKEHSERMLMGDVEYLPEDEIGRRVFEIFGEANKYFGHKELEFAAKARTSFIKVRDFECENEWRVAWFDDYDTIDDESDSQLLAHDDVASEIFCQGPKYGALKFYRELRFSRECLKGITIRAYNYEEYEKVRLQLRLWLAQCGYDLKNSPIGITKTHRVR